MKQFILHILCIGTVLICNLSAKAQKSDYVITDHGDTIKCHIEDSGRPKYKTSNAVKADYIKISADNVQEYYIARKKSFYRRVYIDKSNARVRFLKIIERGPISIYLQVENHPNLTWNSQFDEWYIGKNSDTVKMLKSSGVAIFTKSEKKIKKELAELLKDKKEVYDKFITDGKSDFDDIQNIVHLYNTDEELSKK